MEVPEKEDKENTKGFYVGESYVLDVCSVLTWKKTFKLPPDEKHPMPKTVGSINGTPFDIMGMRMRLTLNAVIGKTGAKKWLSISAVLEESCLYAGTFIFCIECSKENMTTIIYEYNGTSDNFEAEPIYVAHQPSWTIGRRIILKVFFNSFEPEYVKKALKANISLYAMDISKLLESNYGADVEFKFVDADEQDLGSMKAHRCILVTRSDYFEKMFTEHGWSESNNAIIVNDITPHIFSIFLRCLYGEYGLHHIEQDDIYQLYICADKYGQKDICDLLEPQLIKAVSTRKAMDDLYFACTYNLNNLKACCINMLVNSGTDELESMLTTDMVKTLDPEVVRDIIIELNAKKNGEPCNKKRKIC